MKKTIVLLIVLFAVKHVAFDTRLLNPPKKNDIIHAAMHGVGTQSILLVAAPVGVTVAMGLGALDFVIHYSVDTAKKYIYREKYKTNRTVTKGEWWFYTLLDQFLHGLTYVSIIFIVFKRKEST